MLGVSFQQAHFGETHLVNSSLLEYILLGDMLYADVICNLYTHFL